MSRVRNVGFKFQLGDVRVLDLGSNDVEVGVKDVGMILLSVKCRGGSAMKLRLQGLCFNVCI